MASPLELKVSQAARHHKICGLRPLLREASASCRDPDTLSSPLHEVVLGAHERLERDGNAESTTVSSATSDENQKMSILQEAQDTMRFLLEKGAIWNDLDKHNETPGCLALRLDLRELYDIMVDAGVRAEMLLNRLDEYEALGDDEVEEVEEAEESKGSIEIDGGRANHLGVNSPEVDQIGDNGRSADDNRQEQDLQNVNYLKSSLRFERDRLLDDADNGVMMQWETVLMQRHVELLCPQTGLRILNLGFGMGIVDDAFQGKLPSAHHIIEAHPRVLEQMKLKGWDAKPGVTVHEGRWQEIVPKLLEQGILFDAIFFDTFAEDYKVFRSFFSDSLFGLLDDGGKWSFFNGLGADRQISYDVYSKVVEMDLFEAGFDTEWETVQVRDMDQEIWKGVKRKYWTLSQYSLPTCRFLT